MAGVAKILKEMRVNPKGVGSVIFKESVRIILGNRNPARVEAVIASIKLHGLAIPA